MFLNKTVFLLALFLSFLSGYITQKYLLNQKLNKKRPQKEERQAEKSLLHQLLALISQPAFIFNPETKTIFYNACFAKILNLPISKSEKELPSISSLDIPLLEKSLNTAKISLGNNQELYHLKSLNCQEGRIFILEEIENANQEEMRFLFSSIWHEIKTPLTVIEGCLQILEEEKTQFPQLLLKIKTQTQKIKDIIKYLKNLGYENQEPKLPFFELFSIIEKIISQWQEEITEKKLNFEITEPAREQKNQVLNLNKGEAFLLFSNLISNAIKFSIKESVVRLEISHYPEENSCLIALSNYISTIGSLESNLGEVSYQFKKALEEGLGMRLVQKILQKRNGTWHFKLHKEGKVTFQILLPLLTHKD